MTVPANQTNASHTASNNTDAHQAAITAAFLAQVQPIFLVSILLTSLFLLTFFAKPNELNLMLAFLNTLCSLAILHKRVRAGIDLHLFKHLAKPQNHSPQSLRNFDQALINSGAKKQITNTQSIQARSQAALRFFWHAIYWLAAQLLILAFQFFNIGSTV